MPVLCCQTGGTPAVPREADIVRRCTVFFVFDDDLLIFDIGFGYFEYAFYWFEIDLLRIEILHWL
jgi:hypothetical protein